MDDKKALINPTSHRFFLPRKCDGAGTGFAHYTIHTHTHTPPDINILKISPLDYMFFSILTCMPKFIIIECH